jgi:hypothetical protein
MDGAAPAALIERVHLDTAQGELGEEDAVRIAVVGETMDEN